MSNSSETWLDNLCASAAPHSRRKLSNLSLGSGEDEPTAGSSALASDIWNLRSYWRACLGGQLVATKEIAKQSLKIPT